MELERGETFWVEEESNPQGSGTDIKGEWSLMSSKYNTYMYKNNTQNYFTIPKADVKMATSA